MFHSVDVSFLYGKGETGLFSLAFISLTAESVRRVDVGWHEAGNLLYYFNKIVKYVPYVILS